MRRWWLACGFALAIVWSNTAVAQPAPTLPTVLELRDWCQPFDRLYLQGGAGTVDERLAATRCMSYVAGVHEASVFQFHTQQQRWLCYPTTASGGATHAQVVMTFLAWADRHPEQWHEPAILGLRRSTIEAWRCSDTAGP